LNLQRKLSKHVMGSFSGRISTKGKGIG